MAQRKGRGVPICSVVIPAAGSSSRMEGIDKILEPLGELPVLVRTLQVFQSCDLVHEVIVVTREDLIVPVSQLCRDFMLDKVTKVMVGGAERVLSVRIGVQEARRDAALIAIHDGARPLLSREVLEEVLKKAAVTGAAAPAIPMVDTIKRAERGVVVVPDILANAGGMIVSYFEWVQNIQSLMWDEDEVNRMMRQVIMKAFDDVWQRAQEQRITLRQSAYSLALEKVCRSKKIRGIFP